MKLTRFGLAALGISLLPLAAPVHAEGILPPFKVNFSFHFDIRSTAQPTAPWWAYFPQNAHQHAPSSGPVFPHWPTQLPPQAQPTSGSRPPAAAPNTVYAAPNQDVHAAGYLQVPSYWYPR